MAYNKVEADGKTLIDLTSDTVTPSTLLKDVTAHDRSGAQIEGAVIVAPTDVAETEDNTAYLYKSSEHDAVYDELVGGSAAWNQLVQNGNFESTSGWTGRYSTVSVSNNICTVIPSSTGTLRGLIGSETTETVSQNHKLLLSIYILSPITTNVGLSLNGNNQKTISVTANVWKKCECVWTNNVDTAKRLYALIMDNLTTSQIIQYKNAFIIDLTQMFDSTIADYVYNLEQSTAGSGIAWLKSYGFFTKDYYAYNAGSLISANTSGKKVVGKNQFFGSIENGVIYGDGSEQSGNANRCKSMSYVPVLSNTTYTVSLNGNTSGVTAFYALYYDANKQFIGNLSHDPLNTFTTPSNAAYVRFDFYKSNQNLTPADVGNVQIELGSTATNYEPYTSLTYPIQSTDLRGLYKLNGNKLYTDGDIYSADGQITRKYGIVDLGSLEWYKNVAYNVFYTSSTALPKKTGRTNILCQKYTIVDKSYITLSNKEIAGESQAQGINIKDDDYSTAGDFKTAMSGVYLIYELATPTTETAQPFASPQMVYRNGTEEYLDTRDVPIPVGGNRKYIDIPDWMVNKYFDDLRAEASTIAMLVMEVQRLNADIRRLRGDSNAD